MSTATAAASPKAADATPATAAAKPVRERTFQYDESLPSLPVPELPDTFAGLRESVRAVATDAEMAEFDAAVPAAIDGFKDAQAYLHQRAGERENYIGDWWTEFAYLRNRFPSVLNTNVFCVRDSDFDALGGPNPLSHDPVVRTALVIRESLIFRRVILDEQLPPEKLAGKHPMCMRQYKQYWSTRIPGIESDSLYIADAKNLRNVAVMHRGASFIVRAIVDDGKRDELNAAELIAVIRLGLSRIRPPPMNECVGSLTAWDRTPWAHAWKELERASQRNRDNLTKLLDVVTMVCVDDTPVTTLKEGITRAAHEMSHNRWFDRSSLRIVSSNGVCLEHGDHTTMDAIVMASTPVDLMAKMSRDFVQSGGLAAAQVRAGFDPAKHLEMIQWDLTPSLRTMITEAQAAHVANCAGIEVNCYTYLGFGRDALRSNRINADAFVQQALQLATFRDRKHVLPVYETASTRLFREGRTDTIRSLTVEQRDFVTSFDDSALTTAEKRRRFDAAVKQHAAITRRSSTGQGYDRHLLALRIAHQHGLGNSSLPAILELPAVARSSAYQLLTSQMIGRYFVGGFAHVLDDGYGCCYYLRRNAICIVTAANQRAGLTNLPRFEANLTQAFHDLAALVMAPNDPDAATPVPPLAAKPKRAGGKSAKL